MPALGPRQPGDLLAPRYGTGSLADLLPSVLAVLGAAGDDPLGLADRARPGGAASRLVGVRRVVVLLIDGLGYHLLPTASMAAPTLAAEVPDRVLTCGFPSTTPTSLVSLGVGAPPGRHGVVGFTVAIPGTDRVITHVRWDPDIDPARWQPVPSRFEALRAAGLAATVVGWPDFDGSGLSDAAYRGGRYRGAKGVAGTVAIALDALGDAGLTYVYWPDVDLATHRYGPGSAEWLAAVAGADAVVAGIVAGLPPDAALLVTADHGALWVDEADKIDIDGRPELTAGVRVIAGESRVRYAYARPGAAADVLAAWRATLGDAALVASRDEAIAAGWYGPVTAAAAERIGDVVAACTGRYALVRRRTEPGGAALRGYHGSLTETEMAVPLFVLRSVGGGG